MKSFYKYLLLLLLSALFISHITEAQNCSIFAGNDTILCSAPDTLQLNAQPGLPLGVCSFVEWTPATGLSDPGILNPVAIISAPVIYSVSTVFPVGPNLVVNPDFEAGNTGFTNTYVYNCPFGGVINENQYCVTSDPANVHTGATSCFDHTSGSGLQLVINGSTVANSNVWEQTAAVLPNTWYLFSFWVTNWSSVTYNLPTFDIMVNGVSQGLSLEIDPTQCFWNEECLLWYSDAASSATFKIINQVDDYIGNDFSLDDISLQEACLVTDSITISVGALNPAFDTVICEGETVSLTAANGTGYSWLPASGLNCSTCQTVAFTADSSVVYYATIAGNDCDLTDTFNIVVDSLPDLVLSNDTFLCLGNSIQLNAESASIVSWSPSTFLSCSVCNDPVASPANAITYYASASNGVCTLLDSITLQVTTISVVTLPPDTTVCHGTGLVLSVDPGFSFYEWTPATGLSCTNCAETIATPDSAITYTVTVVDSGCTAQDSIAIFLNYADPVYAGMDDSICSGESALLLATGTTTYLWFPTGPLNDETIYNPVAAPLATTTFIVEGSDACGETFDTVTVYVFEIPEVTASYDSIIFCHSGTLITLNASPGVSYSWESPDVTDPFSAQNFVNPEDDFTYSVVASNGACDTTLELPVIVSGADVVIPTAFSPNGDGINDFFFILPSCPLDLTYFRIFNRWGEVLYQTNNINDKWDGTYKSEECALGVYVYVVSGGRPSGESVVVRGNVTLIR
jgi:gliding motility-associated-like protein